MNSFAIYTGSLFKQLVIEDIEVFADRIIVGNPYNTTFKVKVVSGCFSGISQFECDIKNFQRFIKEINEMYRFQRFEVSLDDICYGASIKFILSSIGHLNISGTIFGDTSEHSLCFAFDTDQTAIEDFCKSLNDEVQTSKWKLIKSWFKGNNRG